MSKNKITEKQFCFRAIPVYFVIPAIIYWGLITNFSFNLFYPDWLWAAYNQYLLSILDGRLDVPLEAIGAEGMIRQNNKVYMYYGVLPAIARLLVYPFINLNEVSVSRLFIWLWSIAGVGFLQWVMLKEYLRTGRAKYHFFIFAVASFIIWFGSPQFSLIQNGSVYQEPYAASLFLMTTFLAFIARDVIFKSEVISLHLKSYAFLAALSVHARPNIAVFLYAITLFFIAFSAYQRVSLGDGKKSKYSAYLKSFFSVGFGPLFILLFGGVVLLSMNYVRFEDPFTMARGAYGYYLLEGNSLKFCGFEQSGRFNGLRIIPHALFYFFADYEVYKSISNWLDLGHVSIGVPESRLIIAWSVPVALLVAMFIYFAGKTARNNAKDNLILIVLLLSVISTLPLLSYATIEYRYSADLWMPFGLAVLWGYAYFLRKGAAVEKKLSGFIKLLLIAVVLFLVIASSVYTMSHYELAYYSQMRRAGDYDIREDSFMPHKNTIDKLKNRTASSNMHPCPE